MEGRNSTGIPKQLKTSFCAVEWGMERFIFKWEEGGRANLFMGRGWGVKSSTGEVLVADFLPAPFLMTERDRPRRGGLHSVM